MVGLTRWALGLVRGLVRHVCCVSVRARARAWRVRVCACACVYGSVDSLLSTRFEMSAISVVCVCVLRARPCVRVGG